MVRRRRHRREGSVVRTEPDHNRATGREDEDEFEMEPEDTVVPRSAAFITKCESRYLRSKARKPDENSETNFPFLSLPAEIRNMIYRYLVVSKAPGPIRLDQTQVFAPGGIEIAILMTNHQVHGEASKILYDENKCRYTYRLHPHLV